MNKKDCLIAVFDCSRELPVRDLLRQARITSRKLVLVSRCDNLQAGITIVRAIASENMEFPIRHYHEVDPAGVVELESCRQYEVLNL
ncbi:MAG: hypothetical protein ACK4SY_07430 [Pyrobaculum sp.]